MRFQRSFWALKCDAPICQGEKILVINWRGSSVSLEKDSLETALETITDVYDEMVDKAHLLVTSYWTEWKDENKRIANLNQRLGDENYVHMGRIAPRLKKATNTHRVYLVWTDYKVTPYRKFQNKRSGVDIKPSKRTGYTWSLMSKRANTWERAFFDKYEPLFIKLRKVLTLIADQISMLKKALKTI
ncbi:MULTISPECIES: conjugative transfer protein MobI(A/C) [Shewanella]|uniref:conjugative transfer protein MobI(A/C) n=1 Tax=Shewanella TaxID=22 RepID=UPI0011230AA5|nr:MULTISPECIES: conjugative transfer protein MobI(A/C) [Shewanella]QXN27378.1 hypothetical protein KVP08_023015 [Shewanella putrefaciens]